MLLTFKESKMEDKFPINIPYKETMDIITSVGSDAYALYYYYHSKGMKWKWVDENIAKDLSWSVRKLQRVRDRLKKAGYIYWFSNKGNKYIYLGKEKVIEGHREEVQEKV